MMSTCNKKLLQIVCLNVSSAIGRRNMSIISDDVTPSYDVSNQIIAIYNNILLYSIHICSHYNYIQYT